MSKIDEINEQLNQQRKNLSSSSLEILKELGKKVMKQRLLSEWEGLKGSMFFIVKGISGFLDGNPDELLRRGVYFN